MSSITVEFCGEEHAVSTDKPFTVGRESDLAVDDNPYLHRAFLQITHEHGLWWLTNVGNVLSATVTDASGHLQAWLAPGARLPIFFEFTIVMFTAGSTTYDFTIRNADQAFSSSARVKTDAGMTTLEPIPLTTSQRQLIVALSQPSLERRIPGRVELPSSADAAERLGWTMTTFNRKLDNVCDKLDRLGVTGLRGGRGKLATDRRARLVEYAVSTRLVSVEDLELLP